MVKSEVHLVKPDFVLTVLKGHTAGRLAFLPAKKVQIIVCVMITR